MSPAQLGRSATAHVPCCFFAHFACLRIQSCLPKRHSPLPLFLTACRSFWSKSSPNAGDNPQPESSECSSSTWTLVWLQPAVQQALRWIGMATCCEASHAALPACGPNDEPSRP